MKKILSLLLALTLVFVLVACSSEKNTTTKSNEDSYVMTEKWHYDADGYWLKCKIDYSNIDNVVVTRYSAPDTVERIYTFNNKGNILEDVVLYDGKNEKYEFEYYNDNEQLKKEAKYVDDLIKSEKTYDEHGSLLTSKEYIEGIRKYNKSYKYKYDKNNVVECLVDNGDGYNLAYKCKYDKNNHLTLKEYYENTSLTSMVTNSYKDNMCVEKIEYDNKNNMKYRIVYEYNEKKLLKTISYDKDNAIKGIVENKYDLNGNLCSEIHTDKYGSQSVSFNKEYDEKGNLLKSTSYNSQGKEKVTLWKYDENGNMINCTDYNWDGEYSSAESYTYNDKNQCTEFIQSMNHLGGTKHQKYYYDDFGNRTITVDCNSINYSSEYHDFSEKYGRHSFTELKYEKVSKNIYVIYNKIKEYVPYF